MGYSSSIGVIEVVLRLADFRKDFIPFAVLDSVPDLEDHVVIIQSAYDSEELSRSRLNITKSNAIPSLSKQTVRPRVILSLSHSDPLLGERKQAWRGSGLEVSFTYRDAEELPMRLANVELGDNWGLPVGPRLAVTRMDDDDLIPVDYIEITQARIAELAGSHAVFTWPMGYTAYRGRLWKANTKDRPNQFSSMVSNMGYHPHLMPEYMLGRFFRVFKVCNSRGWVWCRHENNICNMASHIGLKNYINGLASPPNSARWAVQLPPGKY
jgi:hypothetical protein